MNSQRLGVLVIAMVMGVAAAGRASAQTADSRFEVGGQLSAFQLNLNSFGETHAGFGGRVAYDLTDWAAMEGQVNVFLNDDLTSSRSDFTATYHRRRTEAFFGPKIGFRTARFGVFGKVRPGFSTLQSGGFECQGVACAYVDFIAPTSGTAFAMDLGGVFEYYPTSRLVARVDLGDTMVRATALGLHSGGGFIHNFARSFGLGYRF